MFDRVCVVYLITAVYKKVLYIDDFMVYSLVGQMTDKPSSQKSCKCRLCLFYYAILYVSYTSDIYVYLHEKYVICKCKRL